MSSAVVGRAAAVVARRSRDAHDRRRRARRGCAASRRRARRASRPPSRSGRPRPGAGRRATRVAVAAAHRAERPQRCARSPANSVTRGSFWRCVTSCTATGSTITGATPSTRPERRSRSRDAGGVAPAGSSGTPVGARALGRERGLDAASRRRPRRSRPSAATAVERIVWLIVSPVASAAAMIVVPSIEPATISAVRAGPAAHVAHAEPEEDAVAQPRARRRRRARPPSAATSTTSERCRSGCRRACS